MRAKELAEILLKNPDWNVVIDFHDGAVFSQLKHDTKNKCFIFCFGDEDDGDEDWEEVEGDSECEEDDEPEWDETDEDLLAEEEEDDEI